MEFAGERVVFRPGAMIKYPHVLQEHIARYCFALRWASGNKDILDIACGTGYGTAILSVVADGLVVGRDVDLAAVEEARSVFGDCALFDSENIENELAWSLRRPLIYDLVVSFETIEHVDVEKFFSYIKHFLKPDGVLLVSSPVNPYGKPQNPHHKFEFTPQGFVETMRSRFNEVELFRQEGISIMPAETLDGASYGIAVCRGVRY